MLVQVLYDSTNIVEYSEIIPVQKTKEYLWLDEKECIKLEDSWLEILFFYIDQKEG